MRLAGTLTLVVAAALAAAMWVPALAGFERYEIRTGSMGGRYAAGSLLLDRRAPTADLRVGDVITYRPPAAAGVPRLITHRIVDLGTQPDGQRWFRTKGDANPAADPWTFELRQAEQARAVVGIPHLGRVLAVFDTPLGRLVLIVVPAALLALGALADLWRRLGDPRAPRSRAPRR